MSEAIKAYNKERDAALLKDPQALMEVGRKYGQPTPSDPHVMEICFHQCITAVKNLPIEYRRGSKQWLLAHNYWSWDDGDL
jgi:hypothetical protein